MNNNEERHRPEFFNNLSYYKNDKPLPEGFTGKFTDPNFPPNKNSLLSLKPNGDPIDKSAYSRNSNAIYSDSIGWSRPEELFHGRDFKLFDGVTVDDITQGELGDCYYLSALAAVAKYPKMIRGLFKTDKVSENGYYEIVLHIDGKPQIVVIDDYIPCYKFFNMPCFAQPSGAEIWVLLMEKAFAKVNGGYLNIIGGLERESFEILTGFGSKYLTWYSYQLSDEAKLKKYRDYLFKELSQACKHKNHLIGISTLPSAPQSKGLVGSHAYTVLDNITITSKDKKVDLVKIRNPHGHLEWNGDWSDDSPLWGPEEKAQVKLSNEDEGIFFMSLDDAMKYYYLLEICQLVIGGSVFYKIDKKDQINGQVFNIYIPNDCNFGVTVLRKLWRTNREQGNSVYLPTHISVAQYDPDHKRDKYHFFFNYSGMKSSSGLCSWCNRLKRGFYLIYVLQIHEDIKIDMSGGYEVKFDCSGSFKHMKMKSDLRENEYPLLKQLILQAEIELKKYDVYSSEYFYVNSNEIAGNGIGHYIVRPAEGAKYNFNGHFGFCFNYVPLAPYTKDQFNYTVDDDNFLVVLGLTKYESMSSTFNPKSFGFGFGSYKNAPNVDINLNKYASKIVRTLKSCDTQKMGQWDKESSPSDYEQEEEDARKKVEDESNLDSSYNPYQQDKRKKNKKSDIDKIMKELEKYTVIDQDELKKLFEEDSENYKKLEEEENKRKDDDNKRFHDNQKKIYEQIKKAEEEMGKDKNNKDKKNYIDYFKGIPDKYLPDSMKYFLNNLSDIQDFKYDYKESNDGKTTKIKMVAKGRDKDGNLVNNVYNVINNYNQVVNNNNQVFNNEVINNDEDVSDSLLGDMNMDFNININNNDNTNKKNKKQFFNGNPNIHINDNNQIYINNGNPNVNWDEFNKMMNINFNNDMFNNMFPFNQGNDYNFPGFNNNPIKEEVKKEKITIVNKNESKKEIVKPAQNKEKERNIEYKPKTETIYKKNVESQNVNNNNNSNNNNNKNNNNNNKNSDNSFNNNNNNLNNNYKVNIRDFEENERYDYEERRKEMIEKQKKEEGEATCCGGLFS